MKYSVFQDGADFYLTDQNENLTVVTYPRKVRDFDMPAAISARKWFNEVYLPMHAITVTWV